MTTQNIANPTLSLSRSVSLSAKQSAFVAHDCQARYKGVLSFSDKTRPIGGMFASEAVDPEFNSGSVHTRDFRKLVFIAFYRALSIKDSVKRKLAITIFLSCGRKMVNCSHIYE